jgi:hypothetical protein
MPSTASSTIAIVNASQRAGPARLMWHDPVAARRTHALPGVLGFTYVYPRDVPELFRRPIARNARRIELVGRTFGTGGPVLEGTAVCVVNGRPSSPDVSTFSGVVLGGRRFYVFAKGTEDLPPSIEEFSSVHYVIGSCLFSQQALRLIGDDERLVHVLMPNDAPIAAPVRRIEARPDLTLYELETAARVSRVVGELVALLPPGMPSRITIDVPRLQYYCYLLDAFDRGFVSSELLAEWFELVNARAAQVTQLLERELAATGRVAKLAVGHAANLNAVEPAITSSTSAGKPPSARELARVLAERDTCWRLVLASTAVASYRDLNRLSYAVELLRAGMRTEACRPLGVQVDSFGERRILEGARALASRIHYLAPGCDMSLLGLYALERIFTSRETGATELYVNDPGPNLLDADSGRSFSAAQVLAQLYRG